MSIQYHSKANGAAKLYHWGTNQVPIPTHHAPFWRQFVANLMPTLSQSHINQVPIHCHSYQSYANVVSFLCKFIANSLPMQYQSTAMWCKSSANMVSIWSPSKTNGLTISHTWGVNALQMWCQWANPTSIHWKSKTNLPINHQSSHPMQILVQSTHPIQIHDSSANSLPIYQLKRNPLPICQFEINPSPICLFKATLPIQFQSTNPGPKCQSNFNYKQSAILS